MNVAVFMTSPTERPTSCYLGLDYKDSVCQIQDHDLAFNSLKLYDKPILKDSHF